jgi:myo-inositol-1(or 4)-monophosphatase
VAAGYLIVQEAGGIITNFIGEPYNVFDKQTLATNGHIHEQMLNTINHRI